MDNYLVPANAKRGMLIFGRFKPFDLILVAIGVGISLLLLLLKNEPDLTWIIISVIPAFITIVLVVPLPNYHNILTVIISIITFFINRRTYIWKGWCIYDASEYDE